MKHVIAAVMAISLYPAISNAQNKPKYTDSHIVEIMTVTNTGEIDLARLAKEKSDNAEIDMYADHMMTDHALNKEKLAKLAKDQGLSMTSSAKSEDLKMRASAKKDSLRDLKGKSFDKAYIDAMVADHQAVLNTLNSELIPAAQNEELEQLLMKTKETVASHLKHAEKIQGSLKQ